MKQDDDKTISVWPEYPEVYDIIGSVGVIDFSHLYSVALSKEQMEMVLLANENLEYFDDYLYAYSNKQQYNFGKNRITGSKTRLRKRDEKL